MLTVSLFGQLKIIIARSLFGDGGKEPECVKRQNITQEWIEWIEWMKEIPLQTFDIDDYDYVN